MKLHNRRELKYRRQSLRNNATQAEQYLWKFLKGSQLDGKKFRRQHSVGTYVLDFYCTSERLAIEIDGVTHDSSDAIEYDQNRTEFLHACFINVLRFRNEEVFDNINKVLMTIQKTWKK